MPELIEPTERLRAAWLEAHAEWGPGVHEDGFGLLPTDEVDSAAGFAAWLGRLGDHSGRCTYRWIIEGDRVLGGIALRHEFDEFVQRAGHIGYGVRPSARRRGLASWALGQMVDEARLLGLDRVLLVCEAGNLASAATIERQGGIREAYGDTTHGAAWRYWIKIAAREPLTDEFVALGRPPRSFI
ncbi:GNAT family N-acetyltransferase [Arthrobacter sp. FW306-2-2C-D06B]|uniref:GNAT family N-acetyltransferase n=1 Tax=Arthrobacter sp. FW306-2-2C-D06B TaxID=2879618 RepID=UPI001F016721|nr:GNAT family N-acetyltransferase [Arthrobacter sp. FW306-2-2C-D06B]UKA56928.1 GNAT family N-acetyltransferase [Arthrobacter sp. FW306-2-2C-D06B]